MKRIKKRIYNFYLKIETKLRNFQAVPGEDAAS
jgi:hypothetical protein